MNDNAPLVSVIIPSYNSAKTLDKCLGSVRSQDHSNLEIILVDKGSKDGTSELAQKYGAKLLIKDCERAEAKNIGLENAMGKYVCFIDSDMELTEHVLSESVRTFESAPEIGGLTIPERSVGKSFWVKIRDYERAFYTGTEIESARFFTRDLAKKAGGFMTEVVFFEESTLPQKIEKMGYKINLRVSSYILHHEDNFSLGGWLKKKYYYGKTAMIYKSGHREYGKAQMSFSGRLRLFLLSPTFFKKPVLASGVLILKTLEFGAAGAGYMSGQT